MSTKPLRFILKLVGSFPRGGSTKSLLAARATSRSLKLFEKSWLIERLLHTCLPVLSSLFTFRTIMKTIRANNDPGGISWGSQKKMNTERVGPMLGAERPRAFLRWAGSKKQLLPEISKYWHSNYARYIEPFCGSASLFFELLPQQAVLSDINSDLIDTLRAVQISPDLVSECLARLETDEKTYYKIRAQQPSDLAPVQRAARFVYLNLLCFNGLYRVNKRGQFNVPYGSKHRKNLLDPSAMRAVSRALAAADLISRDFETAIDDAVPGDFIYLDPPYATAQKRAFTQYDVNSFSHGDLARLVDALRRADRRGVSFVLSYADYPDLIDLCEGWSVSRVTTRRNIAGFSGSRKKIDEVLISNVEPS